MSSGQLLMHDSTGIRTAGEAQLRRLAARLTVALAGSQENLSPLAKGSDHPRSTHCARSSSVFAAAFGMDSLVDAVDVGSGLWAVKRTSPNGDVHVLCVSNVTCSTKSFTPALHLRPTGDAPLQFISGDIDTYRNSENELVCRLHPFCDVWLGAAIGTELA